MKKQSGIYRGVFEADDSMTYRDDDIDPSVGHSQAA